MSEEPARVGRSRASSGAPTRSRFSTRRPRSRRRATRRVSARCAAAVAEAIGAGHHLVAEAPTGSGKSLAYLAPAVASGLKVVVATSTIALQSQLVAKDLPALQEHVDAAVHVRAAEGPLELSVPRQAARGGRTRRAVRAAGERRVSRAARPAARRSRSDSETGDRTEVDDDIPNATWAAVSCTSVECPGKADCADGAECFAEHARDRAQGASILVVNHALYCAHLAAEGRVLPDHDVVILDEAHSFAENATNAFAGEIATDALTRLAGMLGRAGVERALVDALTEAGKALAKIIDSRRVRSTSVTTPSSAPRSCRRPSGSRRRTRKLDKTDDYAKRTSQLALGRLEVLRRLAAPEADDVVWVDTIGRNRRLRVAPVEPGDVIGAPAARPAAGDRGVGDARRRAAVLGGRVPARAPTVGAGRDAGATATTTGGSRRTPAAGTSRCRRRRRSTGRSRASSTSARTCPIPAAPAPRGSRRRAIAVPARERGRRAGARALHVARERRALRGGAAIAHDARSARPGRRRQRPARALVPRRRDVGARRHEIVLGRYRRGRRRVRARGDRQDPVPGARRPDARGAAARARRSAASMRSSRSTSPRPRSCSRRAPAG